MRDFNFFLPYIDEKKEIKNKKIYVVTITGVLAILILGSLLYNTIYSFKLKSDIKALKNEFETAENQEKLKKAEELNKKMDIMNKYYENVELVYNSVEAKAIVNSSLLYDISKSIPKEVSFKTMTIDTSSIQIQGIAKGRVSIAELEHNLKQLSRVQEVHVSTINSENGAINGDYSFSLKCMLKGGDKK